MMATNLAFVERASKTISIEGTHKKKKRRKNPNELKDKEKSHTRGFNGCDAVAVLLNLIKSIEIARMWVCMST